MSSVKFKWTEIISKHFVFSTQLFECRMSVSLWKYLNYPLDFPTNKQNINFLHINNKQWSRTSFQFGNIFCEGVQQFIREIESARKNSFKYFINYIFLLKWSATPRIELNEIKFVPIYYIEETVKRVKVKYSEISAEGSVTKKPRQQYMYPLICFSIIYAN